MIALVITLAIIGILWFLLNKFGAEFIQPQMMKIINVVIVICVVVFLLYQFGILPISRDIPVPKVR
jgi:hypothetical protein